MKETEPMLTKPVLDALKRSNLRCALADIGDVFNEFRSRYRDSASHELIEDLHQRVREVVIDQIPLPVPLPPEVRHSGK